MFPKSLECLLSNIFYFRQKLPTLAKIWNKTYPYPKPILYTYLLNNEGDFNFLTIWPTRMCNTWFSGFLGSRISYLRLFLGFDLHLTLKFKMAAIFSFRNRNFLSNFNFSTICPTGMCNTSFSGFLGSRISYFRLFLGFDLHMTFKFKMAAIFGFRNAK